MKLLIVLKETLKAVVSVLDVVGMYYLLTRGKSSGETTALAVGLGTVSVLITPDDSD